MLQFFLGEISVAGQYTSTSDRREVGRCEKLTVLIIRQGEVDNVMIAHVEVNGVVFEGDFHVIYHWDPAPEVAWGAGGPVFCEVG